MRKNTPPIGLVDHSTDIDLEPVKYDYSPHLDPELNWSNKENTFEVPTVSLHLHERIDPATIINKVMKKETQVQQTLFFDSDENILSFDKAIQFYQHPNNWSNRFIAGDSLLIMNSLLKKEDLMGKIQMIYIDPPYGIKYGSNFQPFVCKTEVKDKDDKHLAYTPETIRAFRDTWELGIHSYLSYLRDRLKLARDLLTESGSCAIQISDENLHYVRIIMDEIFGVENFVSLIPFRKTTFATSTNVPIVCDYLVWYSKDISKLKYNKMFVKKDLPIIDPNYKYVELKDGTRRIMNSEERRNPLVVPTGSKIYRHDNITSRGKSSKDNTIIFESEKFTPGSNLQWRVSLKGMSNLIKKNRIVKVGNILQKLTYFDDVEHKELTNMWFDTTSGGFENKIYVVQTTVTTIRRFLLMTTDPGDLVLDPTCGSGTTAFVAEQYGRRWITCDTQRVAITLAKRRLMTAKFKYYKLRHFEQGVSSGFSFSYPNGISRKISARTLAYDEDPQKITLHDRPDEEKDKVRVTGPFTVEALPSPTVTSLDVLHDKIGKVKTDEDSVRQEEWRDTLRRSGIRTRNGKHIDFIDVKPHPVSEWFHAMAKTNEPNPKSVLISFGPPYAVLEPRQVEAAMQEIRGMAEKPDMAVFAAMQFDPEAARIIDELDWPGTSTIKVQMSADMLVGNLKKGDPHVDSFMLIGRPDARLTKTKDGMYEVEVLGFDYYDANTGKIRNGDSSQIVMWMLDTDYDGRSIYPQQVFFPMAKDPNGGYWKNIANALGDNIDQDLIKAYTGTKSIKFKLGEHKRAAVKIIDDRGIESFVILKSES